MQCAGPAVPLPEEPPSSPPSPASNHRFRIPSSSQPLPSDGRLGRAPHPPCQGPLSPPRGRDPQAWVSETKGMDPRPGDASPRSRGSGAHEQGLHGGGRGPGSRGLRGLRGSHMGEARGGGVPGIRGPEVERSRRPGGAVLRAEAAHIPTWEPHELEKENFSASSGKEACQGARLTEGRSSAECRGSPTMFPGPHALARARGSGGREAKGRPGKTRTSAALPAPPQAAPPLPPTLQQVAAPRAPGSPSSLPARPPPEALST